MSLDPRQAEQIGAGLPPLLVAAERVAATVAQGLHGRRRVGGGENFWQFRPFVTGDARARIDWRQSAKSDRIYIRETEWDAAQTVALWRDNASGMHWRSTPEYPEKSQRAGLLLLALASLLLRAGERARLIDGDNPNAAGITAGTAALPRIAQALDHTGPGLPRVLPPAHGRIVLFSDFLGDIEQTTALIGRIAAQPAQGALVQILDPAEITLPYTGRVRFIAPGDDRTLTIPRTEALQAAYQQRLASHQARLAALCRGARLAFIPHSTADAPQAALLALFRALTEK